MEDRAALSFRADTRCVTLDTNSTLDALALMRKSFGAGPFRLTLSRKGLSESVGGKS
jgi:hypothetical protein